MSKLHELLAVRDDRSGKAKKLVDETRHVFGHNRNLFAGTIKTTKSHSESRSKEFDAQEVTAVTTSVQARLDYTFGSIISAVDVAATIALTNTVAKADIVIDGRVLKEGVPATTLLELEKEMIQWRETVNLCPTLPAGIEWVAADNQAVAGVFVTKHAIVKKRTEKVTTPVVLYAATDKHPAQVEKVTNDVPVADITEVSYNAMLTSEAKAAMMERADKLIEAVKAARARANDTEVKPSNVGKVLADYLLKGI